MPPTDFVTVERRLRKSCFNFTTVDEPLFAELATLLSAGFDRYLALAAEVATTRS